MITALRQRDIDARDVSAIVECDSVFAKAAEDLPCTVAVLPEQAGLLGEGRFLAQQDADISVCDMLCPSPEHLRALKKRCGRLVSFADEGCVDSEPDIVICPQILVSRPCPTSDRQRVFYGPRYFVVDERARHLRRTAENETYPSGGLMVCLGGSAGWPKAIEIVADALHKIGQDRFPAVSWVVGRLNDETVINQYRDRLPWVEIVNHDAHLLERISDAAIVVTGGGFLKYEAAAVGTPAVILALVDHQRDLSEIFCMQRTAVFVGQLGAVSGETLAEAVGALAADPIRRAEMRSKGLALLDGRGAERICDILLGASHGA